jgi:hypothetical protein
VKEYRVAQTGVGSWVLHQPQPTAETKPCATRYGCHSNGHLPRVEQQTEAHVTPLLVEPPMSLSKQSHHRQHARLESLLSALSLCLLFVFSICSRNTGEFLLCLFGTITILVKRSSCLSPPAHSRYKFHQTNSDLFHLDGFCFSAPSLSLYRQSMGQMN